MDHAGDVAQRLKQGAALSGNTDSVSKSTEASGYDRHVFIVRTNDGGGPFRVTVENVEYRDLTEEEDYLEGEGREALLWPWGDEKVVTVQERVDAYLAAGQRPPLGQVGQRKEPTHRLQPDGSLKPLP